MSDEDIPQGEADVNLAATAPATEDFASSIPADYADKTWTKDIQDIDGLYKYADEMTTMIGKRPAGIPQDTAGDDEWAAFHKAMGVPESVDGYNFPELEGATDTDKAFQEGVKELFLKAGITPKQASVLSGDGWNQLVASLGNSAPSDEAFEKLADETFGSRKEEIMSNGKALLTKYLPEGMDEKLASLPNDALVLIAATLDGIKRDHISEDSLPTDAAPVVGKSEDDMRAEARTLMATPAYADFNHPTHQVTVDKVNAIYASFKK